FLVIYQNETSGRFTPCPRHDDAFRGQSGAKRAKAARRALTRRSQAFQEPQQRRAIRFGKVAEGLAGFLRLAAVPEEGLLEGAGAAVVQEKRVAVDRAVQADAPQRLRAPF